ncbi:hypothetical protein M2157_009722 [Streptomyces sp. SAI-127]|jgi:hypothetical protein|nr:hypothetical protein [Streptomyces sp. SAI-127]
MGNRQRRDGSGGFGRICTACSVVGQCVHARDGRKPFGVFLGDYWLRPETDDHSGAVCEHVAKRPASWSGRSVIVALAVTTVVLAVAAVVMPVLPG